MPVSPPDATDIKPWRLFVALPVPAETAAAIWRGLADLRARHPNARWLPSEHYHLTLVFLGATDPARVAWLTERLAIIAAANDPFLVETAGAGGISGHRGGVAWLRLATGHEDVARLSLAVDSEIESHAYGAKMEPRPHLTVARRVDDALLAELGAAAPRLTTSWRSTRLTLYRSHTGPTGSRYEKLADLGLGAR